MVIKIFTTKEIFEELSKKYGKIKMNINRKYGTVYTLKKQIISFEVYMESQKIVITNIDDNMVQWAGMTWEHFYKINKGNFCDKW